MQHPQRKQVKIQIEMQTLNFQTRSQRNNLCIKLEIHNNAKTLSIILFIFPSQIFLKNTWKSDETRRKDC